MSAPGYDMAAIAEACAASDPADGAEGLLNGLGRLLPETEFRTVLTRGGWFRAGGVVGLDKQRVARSLREWAEAQGTDDLQTLLDNCLTTPMFATRVVGRTHYLTARTGPAAADFVQLEVEELQEVLDRYLSDPDWLPDNLEEFIDPLEYSPLEPEPVSAPRLVFRRFFAAREMINPLESARSDGLMRFMRDWDASTASGCGHFSSRWVLAVRESTDSEGETRVSAHAVPAPCSQEEDCSMARDGGGAELANLIHSYDRAAGYPMAWFFHMVASAHVPHAIGMQVAEDHDNGFEYLPARDLAILRAWVALPYRA